LPENPPKREKTEMIDIKLADNPNALCLIFEGKLTIREASLYRFILKTNRNGKTYDRRRSALRADRIMG